MPGMPVQCWKDSRKMRSWHLETFSGFRWKPPGKAVKLSWKNSGLPTWVPSQSMHLKCKKKISEYTMNKIHLWIHDISFKHEAKGSIQVENHTFGSKISSSRTGNPGQQCPTNGVGLLHKDVLLKYWCLNALSNKNPGLAESISVPLSAPGIPKIGNLQTRPMATSSFHHGTAPIRQIETVTSHGLHLSETDQTSFPTQDLILRYQARGPRLSSVCGPTTHRKMEPVVDCTSDFQA